jgi:hypothetical protein
MSQTTPRAGRGPIQISVVELMGWVLGLGLFAGLARSARIRSSFKGTIDYDRVLCVAGAGLAVGLVLLLAVQAKRILFRQVDSSDARRAGWPRLGAILWRVAAGLVLLEFVAGSARSLRLEWSRWSQIDPAWLEVRVKLVGYGELLFLGGMVAGLVPARRKRTPTRKPPRLWWLSVVWAALAGLLILTFGSMVVPSMVLDAIDHVRKAMMHTPYHDPRVTTRVGQAVPPAVLASSFCLTTALWAVRDLRVECPRTRTPLRLTAAKLALLAGTMGSGLYLYFVTIPLIHEWFSEGIRRVVGRAAASAIAAGFAGLAAGLAARGLAPGGPETNRAERPPKGPFALVGRICVSAAGFFLVMVAALPSLSFLALAWDSELRGPYARLRPILHIVHGVLGWISRHVPVSGVGIRIFDENLIFWSGLLLWVVVSLIGTIARRGAGAVAPFDAVSSDPFLARRLFWIWLALTAVFLAALPTLATASLLLFHYGLAATGP